MKKILLANLLSFPGLTLAHSTEVGQGSMMGMMGSTGCWGGSFWPWWLIVFYLVWLAVGILAIVFLWQKINQKDKDA